jgi:hypothetical protein
LYTETLQHIEPNEILRIKSTEDNGWLTTVFTSISPIGRPLRLVRLAVY